MLNRLQLFHRFTAASVAAQTTAPDRWLVLCDENPSWLPSIIRELVQLPFLRIVTVDEVFTASLIAKLVLDGTPRSARTLITTRLDNDDAIAASFLRTVQKVSSGLEMPAVINCPWGVQMSDGRVYTRWDLSNSFASLVEPRLGARTVFTDEHHRLRRQFRTVQVPQRGMWLQLVHGDNLANRVSGIRANPDGIHTNFPLDLELKPISGVSLRAFQIGTAVRAMFRAVAPRHLDRRAALARRDRR